MAILLGYEVGSGKPISVPLRHTAVTGQTQLSGKTTTLEGLIYRSGLRAVAFVTKRGESSFHVANPIPPYFCERADWQFVAAILEATRSEKLKFQRSWIMKLCQARHSKKEEWKAPKTLAEVQRNVEIALEKATGINESVYTELSAYLKMVVPQIERLPYSSQLELRPGVNVMNLEDYDFPLQALVVRSVIEWVYKHERNTVIVIPEAWEFAPKQRNTPVRFEAESFARKAAGLQNFIFLDSQDIAGVADVLLRQVGLWIFGVQRARHEIERTLHHIPQGLLGLRPKLGDIATLSKGQFIVCWDREMRKVYVQPAWMSAAHAQAIARGEEDVDSAREILRDFDVSHPKPEPPTARNGVLGAVAGIARRAVDAYFGNDARFPAPAPPQQLQILDQEPSDECPKATEERPPVARGHTWSEVLQIQEEEEAMWEEKYNELVKDHKAAQRQITDMAKQTALMQSQIDVLEAAVAGYDSVPKVQPGARQTSGGEGAPVGSQGEAPASEGSDTTENPTPLQTKPRPLGYPTNNSREAIYAYVRQRAQEDPGILDLLVLRPELRVQVERPKLQVDGSTLRGGLCLLLSEGFFKSPRNGQQAFNELQRRGRKIAKPNVYRELDNLAEQGFVTKEAEGYQAVPSMVIHVPKERP